MSNDQITDLKAYIATTVSDTVFDAVTQSETRLTNRLDGLEKEMRDGFSEMRDGFSGVAEAIEQINHRLDNAHIAI
jgi:hypothetical protein